jgi:hypothetical protein
MLPLDLFRVRGQRNVRTFSQAEPSGAVASKSEAQKKPVAARKGPSSTSETL